MRSESLSALALTLALLAATACDDKKAAPAGAGSASISPAAAAGQKTFEDKCVACHTVGQGDRTGPDLKGVTKRRTEEWLKKWLADPVAMGESDHIGREISAKYGNVVMPDLGLKAAQIAELIAFLEHASRAGYQPPKEPPRTLVGKELETASGIYFDRCAGCHGATRQGAAGPSLAPERTRELGSVVLRATMNHGSVAGMPAWGDLGILSTSDVDLMAQYLQMPPSAPPALPLEVAASNHLLKTRVADRPKRPQHKRNWKNFFAVVMKNQGEVAIIDGDTKEKLTLLQAGFTVDTLRTSASGRYLYALGRDGRITLVDLWTNPPSVAAQARGCFDARSLQPSKAKGFHDKLLIEGCYWPPQYVVFDGASLEARTVGSLSQRPSKEQVRVTSIVASQSQPWWAMTLMETGKVAIVDYKVSGYPVAASVETGKGLYQSMVDPSGRYMIAASAEKDELVVVDLQERTRAATLPTGKGPHIGHGVSFQDPKAGLVGAVPHLGEGMLLVFGIDPEKSPDQAWKPVARIEGVAAGGLQAATHPKSPWIWLDSPANRKAELSRQLCVIKKSTAKVEKCWQPRQSGRILDVTYDSSGTEVWVSAWDTSGAILIFDDATLTEKQRIEGNWVVTPTTKINVGNDAADNY
ncbi:MAG: cytochrome D1 domain-containing protein [Polyangiaceae bacterium]